MKHMFMFLTPGGHKNTQKHTHAKYTCTHTHTHTHTHTQTHTHTHTNTHTNEYTEKMETGSLIQGNTLSGHLNKRKL